MKKINQQHLPKLQEERTKIINKIQDKLNILENHEFDDSQQLKLKQQILKLRIKLIGDCKQISVERIEHLQQIFKHYCTHIFKIGKHMTFQRLQYEKVHLTLDRLCVFLKDFGLTIAEFEGQQKEILEKNEIVRAFKRISSNCRDLSFQQFIACLQKLAPLYYDGKEHYHEKVSEMRENRDKRIAAYRQKMKKLEKEKKKQKNSDQIKEDPEQDKEDEEAEAEEENNKLVEDMMKDSNIENPNDEVEENAGKQLKETKENLKKSELLEQEYQLTLEEKIEFFYQMIGVDNVKDFRKKMGELNLPIFKQPKKASSTKKSSDIHVIVEENQQQDQKRLIQLRQKLNQKRERDKHAHSPVLTQQEYEQRKKRREVKHTDAAREMMKSRASGKETTQVRIPQKKKYDLTQRQVSLDMVNHISFDELKYKFDPKKYIRPSEEDNIYLEEYGSFEPRSQRLKIKEKTNSTMQVRKKTANNIVEDFKRRAEEIQKNQFNREAKLTKFMNKIKNNQKILSKF